MAGNSSEPSCCRWYSRCTPVVVSSDTPRTPAAIPSQKRPRSRSNVSRRARITASSSEAASDGSGTAPARSYSSPRCTNSVASPPSSRIRFGPAPSGHSSARAVAHQYSSSVSPFQANTGTPTGASADPPGPTATAAAAWSCVEKMLHEAQRSEAPSWRSVSINTAVCTVMCSEPVMRAPAKGRSPAYCSRSAIKPGISCSARRISSRPNSARPRSLTLKSSRGADSVSRVSGRVSASAIASLLSSL